MIRVHIFLSVLIALCCLLSPLDASKDEKDGKGNYLIGTGIYDMTGPAAEINFMGYARASQTAHGIHQRLRARAFIIAEKSSNTTAIDKDIQQSLIHEQVAQERRSRLRWNRPTKPKTTTILNTEPATQADPSKTICFVSIDAGMGSDLLNIRVLKRLEELLPLQQQGKRLCHLENLSISGTHTHSAGAGFIQYMLYQITSLGFSEEVMQAYTEGVAQAILRAYESLEEGSIHMAQDLLLDANINRSPSSYLLNPQEERDEYAVDHGDTDKTMLQLNFQSTSGQALGILNWFAVHGTSMNSSNLLVSGDNKGFASYLMEKHVNGNRTLPGQGSFVAAFASTNLGDVSPNTAGPRCIDTGLPCDFGTSTCNGKTQFCRASGPGKDMFESTEIIGRKQYDMALKLLENATDSLQGEIGFRHSFIDMSRLNVTLDDGQVVHTCPAALGYSFAAGTTDGPGDFDFTQGTNSSNPFWDTVSGFLSTPTLEQTECQSPKPILLNTGQVHLLYDWDPDIVPISVFRIGQLFILNVPCEFTTMSGRRLRKAVRDVLVAGGIQDPVITIAGLTNSYTHYVTTFEEYKGQRYEAASTIYGPHTLSAYIQEFKRIATDLMQGGPSKSDSAPPDLSKKQISFIPPVGFDAIGWGKGFGSVAADANDQYVRGVDTVAVSFRSANPRNNQRIEGTFLTVDFLHDDGSWETYYVDGDWCTKFYWKGGLDRWKESFAEIHWNIPEDTPQGLYRICHYGTRKTLLGDLESALYHAPVWLKSLLLGSIAINFLLQCIELAVTLSDALKDYLEKTGHNQYKDFEGCTKTFLVRVK